jgi:hypothetical protein
VSAASIVTAHCDANNFRAVDCHSAQSRIASEELSNAFSVVPLGNFQAFDGLPKLKDRVVIVDGKFLSGDSVSHWWVGLSRSHNVIPSEVEESRGLIYR